MTATAARHLQNNRTTVQRAARAFGAVFLLIGVLGFVPGITTNFGELQFAGHESRALLLGIFQVSVLHNIVHLLFGAAGVVLAKTVSAARTYLMIGGLIYLLLWLYGLITDPESMANFVPLNQADDWLHLGLGIAMMALALTLPPRTTHRAGKAH